MPIVVSTVPEWRFKRFGASFPEGWTVRFVEPPLTDDRIIEQCADADYLFAGSWDKISGEIIKASPKLKLLHVEGVGFDKIDLKTASQAGLAVCNNRAVNNTSVAEHTIGLILAGLRRTVLVDAQIKSLGFKETQARFLSQGEHELGGMRVGLIGFGAIGREVASRLVGWNCDVCYYDAFRPSEDVERNLKVAYMELDALISTSDIISIHVPVLPSTEGLINADRLHRMKRSALLINTSRGEIIVNEALAEALEKGQIYGAALDTVAPEPMPADHPLLMMSPEAMARLILTPHIGGVTDEAFTRMLKNSVANFVRVENGEKPVNVVNGL